MKRYWKHCTYKDTVSLYQRVLIMVTLNRQQQRKKNKLIKDFREDKQFHIKRVETKKQKEKTTRVKLNPRDIEYDPYD